MKSSNNVILITGGNSGIGYETAKLFAANGNKIIICGTRITIPQRPAITLFINRSVSQLSGSQEERVCDMAVKPPSIQSIGKEASQNTL